MATKPETPDQYVEELPDDRKEVIQRLRTILKENLPVGYEEEISNGMIDVRVMSIINTSSVNTSPAIGALKMPPIAPAAPQPTSNIKVF